MSNDQNLPDKNYLYGKFQAWEDWRNRLHRKLAHKSLDIADGEDVNVDNSRTGLDWKGLAVLAAAGLGAIYMWQTNHPPSPQSPSSPQSQIEKVLDSEYEVRFYDADGNPIEVQHIDEKH